MKLHCESLYCQNHVSPIIEDVCDDKQLTTVTLITQKVRDSVEMIDKILNEPKLTSEETPSSECRRESFPSF